MIKFYQEVYQRKQKDRSQNECTLDYVIRCWIFNLAIHYNFLNYKIIFGVIAVRQEWTAQAPMDDSVNPS